MVVSRFIYWILIVYALILSGCGKQVIAETEENVLTQDTVQPGKMAASEREAWWNNDTAEQGSLSADEVFVFLKYYGFDDIEPFYVYETEDEGKQLEL